MRPRLAKGSSRPPVERSFSLSLPPPRPLTASDLSYAPPIFPTSDLTPYPNRSASYSTNTMDLSLPVQTTPDTAKNNFVPDWLRYAAVPDSRCYGIAPNPDSSCILPRTCPERKRTTLALSTGILPSWSQFLRTLCRCRSPPVDRISPHGGKKNTLVNPLRDTVPKPPSLLQKMRISGLLGLLVSQQPRGAGFQENFRERAPSMAACLH